MNYRKQMDDLIEKIQAEGCRPRLLMHACCAPCSSSCLVQIREYFDITVFFYNPNITERAEYEKRLNEEKRLIRELNDGCKYADKSCDIRKYTDYLLPSEEKKDSETGRTQIFGNVRIQEGKYEPNLFLTVAKGHEQDPEGGERCRSCFELRLKETARVAAENGFDFFTTSLTLSPLKNAALLNELGEKAGAKAGVAFLPSDFKKKDGYLLSLQLSKEHDLYRQDYCGCVYSKEQSKAHKSKIEA